MTPGERFTKRLGFLNYIINVLNTVRSSTAKKVNAATEAWKKVQGKNAGKEEGREAKKVGGEIEQSYGMVPQNMPPWATPWMWGPPGPGPMNFFRSWGGRTYKGPWGGGHRSFGRRRCHFCQERGHYVRECPKVKAAQGQGS